MKRIILFFLFMGTVVAASAQNYELNFKVRVMNDNNDVRCDSWFVITCHTANNGFWQWNENLSMGEDSWAEFEKTISVPADNIITAITVDSKRETSDCTQRGVGWKTMDIERSWYPCHSGIYEGLFTGYHSTSSLEINIRPLSLVPIKIGPATFDFSTMQSEAYIEANPSAGVSEFHYEISVQYEDDDSFDPVMERDNHIVSAGDAFTNQNCTFRLSRRKIKAIRFLSTRLRGFFIESLSVIREVNDTGGDLDLPFSNSDGGDPIFPWLSPNTNFRFRWSKPRTRLTATATDLPSSNAITLQIQETNAEFQWQYKLSTATNFTNLPAQFGTGSSVTLSGETLFGANWKTMLFKNIIFKAVYKCAPGRETATLTLRHLPSAPGILSVEAIPETCYGDGDAKFRIFFDRPLYTGIPDENGNLHNESILIHVDTRAKSGYPTVLEDGNFLTVTDADFTPGDHTISLTNTFGALGAGYSTGANHTRESNMPPRLPVTNFVATKFDIHCFEGKDGRITASAQGGTHAFTAQLFRNDSLLSTRSFAEGASGEFTELRQANYTVKLEDSYGCDAQGGDKTAPISYPTQKVILGLEENVEPLGFGRTDGYITVRAQNGTMPYTFQWTDINDAPRVANPPQTEGSSMTSTLRNLGKGVYHVRSEDSNYALASPQTETNLRGCYDTLTIIMTEPPLLEVSLAEHAYVSCYGRADGAVVAHAKGGRPYRANEPEHPYQYEWFEVENGVPAQFNETDSIAAERPSSYYRVKVTDRNGITAWSNIVADFLLVQPDPLKLYFTTSQLLCNGDANGTSTVVPQGGTQPYKYAWSTDDTTSAVSGLTDGWYSVVVTDTRRCTTFDQTEVVVPGGLTVEAEVINPTCFQYSDGSIRLDVTSGKGPYRYSWAHGGQTAYTSNLAEGDYEVVVTDANDCHVTRQYTLEQPELLPVGLGTDKVLCKDQVLPIDATIEDPAASYNWTLNGAPFASTPVVELIDAGTYRLLVTDSKGCLNGDDVTIARDETEIGASIVVATRVPQGGKVRIANISHPAPDRIEWIIPEEATVMEETPGYLDVTFMTKGDYSIGLTSFKGSCDKTVYAPVRVVDKSELTDYKAPDEPYIKQFLVTPNPNNGQFTATVELREVADFTLILYTGQGTVVTRQDIKQKSSAKTDFDVTSLTSSGVHVLQLVTAGGYSTFKIVIQ